MVTSFECWCPTLMLRDRGCWLPNSPKPSATSKNCHQHISSPTSITNIDVAEEVLTLPSIHYHACCPYFSFKKSPIDLFQKNHLCKFLAESSAALLRVLGDEILDIENEFWLSIVLNDFILNDWNIICINAECQTVSRYLLLYKTETNVIFIYKPDHLPAKYIILYILM